jgi:hypothetical protein
MRHKSTSTSLTFFFLATRSSKRSFAAVAFCVVGVEGPGDGGEAEAESAANMSAATAIAMYLTFIDGDPFAKFRWNSVANGSQVCPRLAPRIARAADSMEA